MSDESVSATLVVPASPTSWRVPAPPAYSPDEARARPYSGPMSTGGSASATRRARALPVAVLLVVSLAALLSWTGWVAWTARAEAAAESVHVTASGSPECAPGRDVNDGTRLLVVATPDVVCTVRVVITNDSERDVHLDAIRPSSVGMERQRPENRYWSVMLREQLPEMWRVDPTSGNYDYLLDDYLPPGSMREAELQLVPDPSFCDGAAELEIIPWPGVLVTVGGQEHVARPSTSLRLGPSSLLDRDADCTR